MRLLPATTVLAAVSATVLLAACSSSSSGSGSPATTASSTTSSSSTSSSSSSSSGSAPSEATLKAEMVTAADLGSGWKATASTTDNSDDPATDKQVATCLGVSGTPPTSSADVNSDDFSKGQLTVSTNGSSYASASDIAYEKSLFTSSKIESCLTTLLKKELATTLPSGTTLDNLQVQVQPGPVSGYPGNVIALSTAKITATASGQQVSVVIDSAYLAGARTTVELDFEGDGEAIPSDLETSVLKTVAARVTA